MLNNKIPSVTGLVKKTHYDAEIKDLKINISPHLITVSSRIIYLMEK